MDMGKLLTAVVVAVALLMIPAANVSALEVEGVTVAEEIEICGAKVALNGAGIRTKLVFDAESGTYSIKRTD